jgi:hypothetical protein
MDERKWHFRSRDSGFERVTPLRLYREIDGSFCDDAGAGVLVAMSHPTNGTASNFRVAKFRDSSGLVAPERIWRSDRPGSSANFGHYFRSRNLRISFIFMRLEPKIDF